MERSSCISLVLCVVVAWFGILSSLAVQQPLPDAGQVLCRDVTGVEIPCDDTGTCPGQDAFYTTGCPLDEERYVIDNGGTDDVGGFPFDDVVKDNCTGLMWSRNMADYNGDGMIDLWGNTDDAPDWENAFAYCADLVLTTGNGFKREQDLDGGDPDDTIRFDDWHLSNVGEILSIQNWDSDPAHDQAVWFGASTGTWTSTSRVDVFEGGFCAPDPLPDPPPDQFNTGWRYETRGGTTVFGTCKRGNAGFHPVRTMLPGDDGGGGAGAGGDGDHGDDLDAEGGGAGPPCATENGDDDGIGGRNIADAIYKLGYLFQGGPEPVEFCGAAGPQVDGCAEDNGDDNGDGGRDLSDAIYKLLFLFRGGPAPVLPCVEGTETICDDFFDDDDDGFTDCDDPDCIGQAGCPGPEICDNNIDDDLDGAADCTDHDCAQDASCQVEGGTGLPDTGQRTCYSTDAEIIPCPGPGEAFFGQDGSHDTGCGALNRFTDNGDDTVTDECTGLTWQQIDDGVGRLWREALVHCEGLTLGGEDDWRMRTSSSWRSLSSMAFSTRR